MRAWGAVGLVALLSACDPAPAAESPAVACDGAKCDEADGDDDATPDMIRLGEFSMCLSPASATEAERDEVHAAFADMPLPNLDTLWFLVHAAGLAYEDAADFGPALATMGFGKPGDGQWLADCGTDVQILGDTEAADPFATEGLSACALDWYGAHGGSPAQFQRWFEGTAHADHDLQFFSAEYDVAADGDYVRGSTQLLWAEHFTGRFVLVAFRGTEFPDKDDLWTDADFGTVPSHWGRVHGGFAEALESVEPALQDKLAQLEPGTPIWVTGHSLGGALASLFAADLLVRMDAGDDINLAGLVTWGSPRVGNDIFFEQVERVAIEHRVPLHRVANVSNDVVGYDPITHVPFRNTFGQDFGHVGAPIELYDTGILSYALQPSRGLLPWGIIEDAIDAFKERVGKELSKAFPHLLHHYVARLQKAMTQSQYYPELLRCDPASR